MTRGSIVTGLMRGLSTRSFTTWSALSNAALTSSSEEPYVTSKAIFVPSSGCTSSAPLRLSASSTPETTGSGSHVRLDQVERIAGVHRIVGQYGGHRLAGIARFVGNQQRMVDLLDVGHERHDVDVAQSLDVLAREHRDDARRTSCLFDVERDQPRVRKRTSKHAHMQQVCNPHVLHVPPRPRHQPPILKAAERLAYPTHRDRVRVTSVTRGPSPRTAAGTG